MNQRSDSYRIVMDTLLAPTTVAKVMRGEHVRPSTRRLVEIAARRLKIKLPAPQVNP